MSSIHLPEVWLRGALPHVPALLQPVAHCVLQAKEEINKLMEGIPEELLWQKPAGVASPGFHLQHIAGVIDRLYTYAEGETLSEQQFSYLKSEGTGTASLQEIISHCTGRIDLFIDQLKKVDEASLKDQRVVGRAQLPSTKMGLLFHAAEHTMRHLGQLIVTVQVLKTSINQ